MRIDIDTYREIIDTLTRNKSRSFLTGFGVFWGVFMLVALMGGGKGLKEKLDKNFEGFAQNTVIIGTNQTTKPYKGFRKGRWWVMEYKDIERLKQKVPEINAAAPILFSSWRGGNTAYYGDQKTTPRIQGTVPELIKIIAPKMYYGRYLNEMDIQLHRKVCVIGKHVYKDLFPQGGDPCGQSIRIDQSYYHVVGVDYSSGNISINGNAEDAVSLRIAEDAPQFPGGPVAMMKWLTRNLHYPKALEPQHVQGKVVAEFIVNKDGSIAYVKVTSGLHPLCDAEVLRVLRMMPRWKPGVMNGEPCRTKVCVPVVFKN